MFAVFKPGIDAPRNNNEKTKAHTECSPASDLRGSLAGVR